MKIAIIGQSAFGSEVFKALKAKGHDIVGVFTIPDTDGREDVLAQSAAAAGVRVFKVAQWRSDGKVVPELLQQYTELGAELNVLPFCSQFIPMEVADYPKHKSIIYHPSVLPRHRGASAINWTLIEGDEVAGFTVFWADDGLDTGPILLTRETKVEINDTLSTLYKRFLFPEGVTGMVDAVDMIAAGEAPSIPQPAEGATYDKKMTKELARIDWSRTGKQLHNMIRGCDRVPGAWCVLNGKRASLFGSELWAGAAPASASEFVVDIDGYAGASPPIVHAGGLLLSGTDGQLLSVASVRFDEKGVTVPAGQLQDALTE